jgi:hypothetical protein
MTLDAASLGFGIRESPNDSVAFFTDDGSPLRPRLYGSLSVTAWRFGARSRR